MIKTIDLHIHTTCSDGSYTPRELVDYAVKKKLAAIAITDHDNMDGIQEAIDYIHGNNLSLELIPGMEVSTNSPFSYFGVHILAYFIDKDDSEIKSILKSVKSHITNKDITSKEAIKLIKQHNGIACLAHPQEYALSIDELDKLVSELASFGLKGIEGIYTTHSEQYTQQMKAIALRYNLIITGGSDFHGTHKAGVDLGSGFGDMVIPYEIVDILKNETRKTNYSL